MSNDQPAALVASPWLLPPIPAWKPKDFWEDLPLKVDFENDPPVAPIEPEDSVPVSVWSISPSPVGRTSMRNSLSNDLAPVRPSIWIFATSQKPTITPSGVTE